MIERRNIPELLTSWMDEVDTSLRAPRITISGAERVLVDGHRGLLEYAEDRIAAACAGGRVVIRGEGLVLAAMNASQLVVTGRLWAVEFE